MRNKKIDALKFLAIFSVVCAHTAPTVSDNIISKKIGILFNDFGCVGVGIFLAISGYFYYNNNKKIKVFLNEKINTIFIPWLFVGTLVYILVFYFQNTLSFLNYIKFLVGYGSYLYFLTILILLYIIYSKLKDNICFLNITTILSLMSITITTILGYNSFSYLNVFNWMIYFNIGIYIKKYNLMETLNKITKKYFILIIFINTLTNILIIIYDINIGYWTNNGLIYSLITSFFFISILEIIKENKLVNFIGKNTMPIYLIHMPIAGILVRIANILNSTLFDILKPIITLLITTLVIYIYNIIVKKIGNEKLKYLIGIR